MLQWLVIAGWAVLYGSESMKLIVVTQAGNFASALVFYYWGSSVGSAKKDDALLAQQAAAPTSNP